MLIGGDYFNNSEPFSISSRCCWASCPYAVRDAAANAAAIHPPPPVEPKIRFCVEVELRR
jgi:hypothetical protein